MLGDVDVLVEMLPIRSIQFNGILSVDFRWSESRR